MNANASSRLLDHRIADNATRRAAGISARHSTPSNTEAGLFARHLEQGRRAAGHQPETSTEAANGNAACALFAPSAAPSKSGRDPTPTSVNTKYAHTASASMRLAPEAAGSSAQDLEDLLAPRIKGCAADARFKVYLPDGSQMLLAVQARPQGIVLRLITAAAATAQALKASAPLLERRLAARCGRPVMLQVAHAEGADWDA